jgi:hypothetical protein
MRILTEFGILGFDEGRASARPFTFVFHDGLLAPEASGAKAQNQ